MKPPDLTLPVVIDTNVWLDLLVFDDPGSAPLAGLLADGTLEARATRAMRDELADVLARPRFRLASPAIEQALARFDAQTCSHPPAPDCRLDCRDRDDRKFLDLAVVAAIQRPGAWLISKDRALLAARKSAMRRFSLQIGVPRDFLARHAGLSSYPTP